MNWIFRLLTWFTDNHGYETQPQRRFNVGEFTTLSRHASQSESWKSGDLIYILETGRKDYLIENKYGDKKVVYQYELDWDNRVVDRDEKKRLKEARVWEKMGIIDF